MCHVIRCHRNKFYYGYDNVEQRIYGLKLIRVKYDENNPLLASYYLDEVYDYTLKDGMIEVRDEPKFQGITLSLSIVSDEISEGILEVEGSEFAGMHISPLILEDEYHFREYTIDDWENAYIVWFNSSDIVFYDGMDISVTRFVIPKADVLERDYVLRQIFIELDLDALIRNHKYLYSDLGIEQQEENQGRCVT